LRPIVVSTSGESHCDYCVVAHSAILRIYNYTKNPTMAENVNF